METQHRQGVIMTTTRYRKYRTVQKELNQEEPLVVEGFETTPAHASVALGHKVNMGEFNSWEVRVSVSLPCYAEEVEDAIDAAKTIAYNKLLPMLDKLKAAKESRLKK